MFLTHMPLNPQRRSTREMVGSPQRLHAAVLSGFLPGTSDQERILWRLDRNDQHHLDLYLVSKSRPSLDALAEQAGWSANPVWRTTNYDGFLSRLSEGQRWIFRLTANPIRNVRAESDASDNGSRARGKRVPLVTVEDQTDWLVSRAPRLGFDIAEGSAGTPNLALSQRRQLRFKKTGKQRQHVTLETVRFDGVLEVTDAETLRSALVSGVGSAKGYGCGLLTLAAERVS